MKKIQLGAVQELASHLPSPAAPEESIQQNKTGGNKIQQKKKKEKRGESGDPSSSGKKKKKAVTTRSEVSESSGDSDESARWNELKRTLGRTMPDVPSVRRSIIRSTDEDSRSVASDCLQRCAQMEQEAKDGDRKPMRDVLLATTGINIDGIRNKSRLPKFLQKPQPRGAEIPISLGNEEDVRKTTDATPLQRANVTEALPNASSEGFGPREDDRDLETKRMLADSLYILRGSCLFEVCLVEGVTGKELTSTIRRSSNSDKEMFRDEHTKCPINNRICCAVLVLRFGAKKLSVDEEQSALLSDFGSVPNTTLEDSTLTDEKLERRLSPPTTLHAFTKDATNQINFPGSVLRRSAEMNDSPR